MDGASPARERALKVRGGSGRGDRHLRHPRACSSAGRSSSLIRRRTEVQILSCPLAGNSAGQSGVLIRRRSRVQVPSGQPSARGGRTCRANRACRRYRRAVSSEVERRAFNPRSSRVRTPDGPQSGVAGAMDSAPGFYPDGSQFESGATRARPRSAGVSGDLARPSTWRLPVRTRRGARITRPHRPWVRIAAFQAAEQSPSLCGATAE
jgi:hypothetical protein